MATKKRTKKRAKPKAGARKKKVTKKTTARSSRQKTRRAPRRPSSRRTSAGRGEESGDLQGISRREAADSESVDELLEEGNAFEAGVVAGVEEADVSGPKEVHTREVPEDDVPEEYLDNDQ